MKILISLLFLSFANIAISQDSIPENENRKIIALKTNILMPLIRGAELSAEWFVSKKFSIQGTQNFYDVKESIFWPGERSQCSIIAVNYFMVNSCYDNWCNGLYAGVYSRFKSSRLINHWDGRIDYKYFTTSLNYGLTMGAQGISTKGFVVNPSVSLGTGINLTTDVIRESDPDNRNEVIKSVNIGHLRMNISFGYAF